MNVIDANVIVHTAMAAEYHKEPHFSVENRAKIRSIIEPWKGGKMLDLGCGTGFMLDLAHDLFDEVHGVDVTQAMLDRVTPRPNLTLHQCSAEKTPFPSGTFDLVTAYSFIHHLANYKPVLREARRVLKDGGRFYIDLEPNAQYWSVMKSLEGSDGLSPIVAREVHSVCKRDAEVAAQFGLDPGVFDTAEFLKARGGIEADELVSAAQEAGFSSGSVEHHWFLGQGRVTTAWGEDAQHVCGWLNNLGQMGGMFFKYLRFELIA